MHYKTEALTIPLAPIEPFEKDKPKPYAIRRLGKNTLALDKAPATPEVVILSWK
jgi:hypothetical protein